MSGTNVSSSNPAKDDGFLRAIKIHSMTYFQGEVKPAVLCCKTLQHVKDPCSMKEILVGKICRHFLPSFSCIAARHLHWLVPERSGG